MPAENPAQAGILLARYYAAEDAAAERALGALVDSARPRVRAFLTGKGVKGEDLEDLCSAACLQLLEALRRSHAPGAAPVQDCAGYACQIASHVLVDSLRRERARHQFRRQVIALLDGRFGGGLFARWQMLGDWLGGLHGWRGKRFTPTTRYRAFAADRTEFLHLGLEDRSPQRLPLPELMAYLFRWLETPVEVGELTEHLAVLKGVRDTVTVFLEDLTGEGKDDPERLLPPSPEDVAAQVVDALSCEESRGRLWQEVCELSGPQRAALLLGMEWSEMILLAGRTGCAAEALSLPLEELLLLAHQMPLPDRGIAQRLGLTAQQVSNLRKCARERLARRMARWKD